MNKLRFALLLGFAAMSVTAWSQAVPYINKMSITTQMFLDEMANTPSLRMKAPATTDKWDRPFAAPQEVNGKVCIDAFVRVSDERAVSELEALGVAVQCRFNDGLLTAGIPVDALEQVAALDGVTQIEVSPLMRLTTGIARQATNADDVLTLSSDAQAAGLASPFDGSGVLLAVVDQGIQFSHPAFKDASGNTRIKRAIVNDTEYTNVTSNYGNAGYDHGTHTSSIAGGSSVVVSGSTVTVTGDHSQATYGGMAPGADLYLCDLSSLSGTMIANAFQKICNYADAQNQPVVVNNSWGSTFFAHDGSSNVSSVMSQYFGDSNPNHICLFAASNDAGHSYGTGYSGGYYVTGTATSSNPLGTIIRYNSTLTSSGGYSTTYAKTIANAWTRATDATGIGINIHVVNASTGAILQTVNKISSGSSSGSTANTVDISTYFSGTLDVYFDYVSAGGKKQVLLYSTNGITARGNYLLAIEVYPIGGSSSTVDIWGGDYTFFANDLTTSGHTWLAGTDDMTIGDEAAHPDVIAVGAYVTSSRSGNYVGQVGDIFYQSSYATAAANPAGTIQPWITAPGAEIIAAYNYYNYNNHDYTENVVNSSVSNGYAGYGTMSGTSMAAPMATGIVALWLQAAREVGKTSMTTSEVKNIMQQTAIKDSYVTTGSNASHFGNGKIDALAGVQYILDNYATAMISPSETQVNMTAATGSTATASVTIGGYGLTSAITATVSDPSNVFTVGKGNAASLKSSGTVSGLAIGDELAITYAPTAVGTHTATITLSSNGVDDVTITLNGIATQSGATVSGEETVCNATTTNNYVPVCRSTLEYNSSTNGRKYHTSQMIYPASSFTTMTAGSKIKSITFYVADGSWYTIPPSIVNSTMEVRVGEVTATAVTASGLTGRTLLDSSCEVYNGTPTISSDSKEMTFTFSGDGYTWNGGNLAIEIYVASPYNNDQSDLPWKVAAAPAGSSGHTYYYNRNSNYVTTNASLSVLPQMTVVFEGGAIAAPALAVDPAQVAIEDETGDARDADVAVIGENLTGGLTTSASAHWTATLSQDNATMNVAYNGKALHQTGVATVSSQADGLSESVATEYLYTGPIYVIGDVNNYAWNANNGVQLTRDSEGLYTGTITTQASSDAAYILFTKRLGSDTGYRFGPVSDGNWWLVDGTTDVFCDLDTVGNLNNMRVAPGTYFVTIDSRNNQFKIRPAQASSSVSPQAGTMDFGQVTTGGSATRTITITNDGETAFTPTVATGGAFSTDYTPAELAPGESVTVTVTFAPGSDGDYSQPLTVTAGDDTYSYTLTGTAGSEPQPPVEDNVVRSNTVTVPVYKTAIDVLSPYTLEQLDQDTDHALLTNVTNSDLMVKVARPTAITRYDVYHHEDTKADDNNWAPGQTASAVAYANHDQLAGSYLPFAMDADTWTTWDEQPVAPWMDNNASNMWIHMNDYVEVQNHDTWYVPVVVANGKVSKDNTYGAPMLASPQGEISMQVNYDRTDKGSDHHNDSTFIDEATGVSYYYMTAKVTVTGTAPVAPEGANYHYECYMARAWRVWTPYVIGVGTQERTEVLMGTQMFDGGDVATAVFGNENWERNQKDKGTEPGFISPRGADEPEFIARFYYVRVPGGNATLRAGGNGGANGGGVAGVSAYPSPDGFTGMSEYQVGGKAVVDVTYVNPLGMTSKRPFEGVNIVVTRYDDGTTSTAKVLNQQ